MKCDCKEYVQLMVKLAKSSSYSCDIWFLTLREERRLREFMEIVFRKTSGPKREDVTGSCTCPVRSKMICTPCQTFLGY